jgi:hypothetical protein
MILNAAFLCASVSLCLCVFFSLSVVHAFYDRRTGLIFHNSFSVYDSPSKLVA